MQSDTVSSSALSPLGAPSFSTSSPSQTPAPAPSPPPALTSIVSPSGYTYPPIFSFPPFFTPQPNASTLAHQLSLWTALVLSWARWHRVFELRAEDVGGADVWENKPLKRKAGRDFQRSIMQALVQGGQATSLPPLPPKNSKDPPTAILLYWLKPEEWAAQIYDWVSSTGQTNSILTFSELQSEEGGKKFYDLPLPLLRSSLAVLVKQGKAQVFKVPSGEGGEEGEGVKFA